MNKAIATQMTLASAHLIVMKDLGIPEFQRAL
jgi:hypothetical protein